MRSISKNHHSNHKMASPTAETKCEVVEAVADDVEPNGRSPNESAGSGRIRRRRKRRSSYLLKFACLRSGSLDTEVGRKRPNPAHLVIMVNGLMGSRQDWRFAAKQFFQKYPQDILVHCSKRNPSMSTFDGVDVMGKRLAEEVEAVVNCHPNLKKISFIGHSLGGLVARYAIAILYGPDFTKEFSQGNSRSSSDESGNHRPEENFKDKIAGLEPVNFITSATPHLGSRGHKQVPVFCGLQKLEKLAARASWLLGRTGKHLFLTDCDDGKPPLLLQMIKDTDNLKFVSALQSFKRRVAYANASFDYLVGWSTSSLRRRNELPKRDCLTGCENYKHVINVEAAKAPGPELVVSTEHTVGAGNATGMEEEMLRHLTALCWERVDVSFSGSKQRFFAHNTIQVKTYCINSDGADVVKHMIENFEL